MLNQHSLNGATTYLENIIEVLNEIVVVLDAEHRIVEGSAPFYTMIGVPAADAQGQAFELAGAGEWDRARLQQLLHDLILQHDTVRDYEVNYCDADGVLHTFAFNARCFCQQDNPANLVLLALRDITALRSAEGRLEQKIKELQARNAALDAFAHHVAHDLKNPVSSIVGFASLITTYHERMPQADIVQTAHEIIASGHQLREIIDALLLLASVDRLEDVPNEILDMHTIVEQTRKNLDYMIRQYRTELHLASDWPEAHGYSPWVQAVWANYISNAIKYGGKPPVLHLGAELLNDQTAYFWVQDNGAGLSKQQQQEIFKPFARLAGDEIEGHGLGLAVVRRIVERLGGRVVVESNPGQGSRFGFTLPSA